MPTASNARPGPVIRRLDIAYLLAALAFAIAAVVGAHAEPAAGAKVSAIPGDLIRNVLETWAGQRIEATNPEIAARGLRHEASARWQGDILLATPGVVDFRVRAMSARPFRGPTVVRLELNVDGQLERALTVTVDCRLYGDVVVTNHALRAGSALTAAALAVEERDVTSLNQGCFTSVEDLVGMQARRPIGVGEVVSRTHVEPVPVVRRGDEVALSLETGTMSLVAGGVALQDGGVGQKIRVRNADSGKVLYAEVVDAATVRVVVTGG